MIAEEGVSDKRVPREILFLLITLVCHKQHVWPSVHPYKLVCCLSNLWLLYQTSN